jgi:hypothetical protein
VYGARGCGGYDLLTVFEGKTYDIDEFIEDWNDKILSYKVHCI